MQGGRDHWSHPFPLWCNAPDCLKLHWHCSFCLSSFQCWLWTFRLCRNPSPSAAGRSTVKRCERHTQLVIPLKASSECSRQAERCEFARIRWTFQAWQGTRWRRGFPAKFAYPDLDSQMLVTKSECWNPKAFVAWRPRLATEPLVKIVDEVRDLEGKPLISPRLSQLRQVEASWGTLTCLESFAAAR